MKKYGKYETRPVAGAKQPKMKSALLQTYFVSLLCLVLCMTMFFGTTYAWFTSEVNNGTNEIYIGTLDVGMFKVTSGGPQDLAVVGNKLFDNTIRWEPGYTAMETIQIVNDGDLAFKYVLNFTDGAATNANGDAADLKAIAKYFDVWVYDQTGKSAPAPANYDAITAEGSGWVNAGSLEQLLNGQSVLNGVMQKPQQGEAAPAATYVIALHMNPLNESSEAAAVMGKKVSLSVKLVAYQMVAESDGHNLVATAKELADVFAAGGNATLVSDIKLTEGLTVAAGKSVSLDLNGHTISMTTDEYKSVITNDGTLIIDNKAANGGITMNFVGTPSTAASVNVIANKGELTVNGGAITNKGSGNQIGYGIDNYNGAKLTVNGGAIKAEGSTYYDGIRLFCGSNDTVVTVNGGEISSIWAQNPTNNKATEVKGTVIVNGGNISVVYYENYTTVRVAVDAATNVMPYGNGKENTTIVEVNGYKEYSFVNNP